MLCYFLAVVLAWLSILVSSRSFVSYAALGDSYASGNGAGSLDNVFCGQFTGAYPAVIAQHQTLAFKDLACAGALTSTILATQVPFVGESDLVTVQVGGNEANFFSVLNGCVKEWLPFASCEDALATTFDILESTWFTERYDGFVSDTVQSLDSDTTLLVLGYSRFFNDEADECDNVTFSESDPTTLLTKDKRRALNQLVFKLNSVIEAAAEAHGAYYVDIDGLFEGHRFCESGTIEPSRSVSWFFNDVSDLMSSDLVISNESPETNRAPYGGFFELTKSFHPTLEGHAAIADEVVRVMHAL